MGPKLSYEAKVTSDDVDAPSSFLAMGVDGDTEGTLAVSTEVTVAGTLAALISYSGTFESAEVDKLGRSAFENDVCVSV